MKTFADIINDMGGPAEYGRLIGIPTERAAEQRARGSISPRYWPAVIDAARGHPKLKYVTHETLVRMYAARRELARAS